MRNSILLLLLLATAFTGCMSDDGSGDGTGNDGTDGNGDGNTPEPNPIVNRDGYTLNTETGQCDATEYETVPGDQAYTSSLADGTWVFQESNGIPGLQYENNHPAAGGSGFDLPVDEGCTNGDQVVA